MLLNRLILILIFAVIVLFVMPGSVTDFVPQLKNSKTTLSEKFSQFFNWGQDLFARGVVKVRSILSWATDTVKVTYKRVSDTVGTYWNETKIMLDKILRIHEIIKE